MARIKYNTAATPITKKHDGFTFMPNHYGFSMFPAARNARKRYLNQWYRMQANQKAVTQWRNMSTATQNAWSAFASAFPIPAKSDPTVFLNGFELFVKRNTYHFLNEGLTADFILEPVMESLPSPSFTVEISQDGMCLDVSEWYIKNFGLFPEVGQSIICKVLPMAIYSGQFFTPYIATLEVENIYIDGLFLTINFTGDINDIVFSVFLSKPISAGRKYPSTKFRYMGCFKPTKFIQLTDTPESYSGQSGKFVAVNEEENGVEFVEAGGGGLDCDDLNSCSIISSMSSDIDSLQDLMVSAGLTSLPAIKFGLLYNDYAMLDSRIANGDFRVPVNTDWALLSSNVATHSSDLTPLLKMPGDDFWLSNSSPELNTLKFNAVGSGARYYNTYSHQVVFGLLKSQFRCWNNYYNYTTPWPARSYSFCTMYYNGTGMPYTSYATSRLMSCSIRLVKSSTTLLHGQSGMYVGNNGNKYRTIGIGDNNGNNVQEWLADNLAETKLSDGSSISEITGANDWANATIPALCAYDNDWNNV